MKLERYRNTMTPEVLQSWAEDAQNKIDALSEVVQELLECKRESLKDSPEGRAYVRKMEESLNR